MKTARDIIDGTFRALYRDARDTDELVAGDPFAKLDWPRKVDPVPDPFTATERDKVLAYFRAKDRWYYALVYLRFWTGLRTGEALGLRRSALDLSKGKLEVRVSRSLREDNAPKTRGSARTIEVAPDVLTVLRETPVPLHGRPDAFVFTTQHGTPIMAERFAEKWQRALTATGLRARPFYNCRHAFISVACASGVNLKWLASYCGTSIEMIERHYAKWLGSSDGAQLARLGRASDEATDGDEKGTLAK
jgi:integrase